MVISEALKRAKKKYYEKVKKNDEYRQTNIKRCKEFREKQKLLKDKNGIE